MNRSGTVALCLLVLVLAIYSFLQSPFFGVVEIEVTGNDYRSDSEILLGAGVVTGLNIFRIDPDRVRRRLTADPFIDAVSVQKIWPRRVRLHICEATPVAVIPYGTKLMLVDRTGRCIIPVEPADMPSLPVLSGGHSTALTSGEEITDKNLAVGVVIAGELSEMLANLVSEIILTYLNNIYMYTRNLARVELGNSSDLEDKLRVLAAFTAKGLEGFSVIDVRSPGSPTVRRR